MISIQRTVPDEFSSQNCSITLPQVFTNVHNIITIIYYTNNVTYNSKPVVFCRVILYYIFIKNIYFMLNLKFKTSCESSTKTYLLLNLFSIDGLSAKLYCDV